MRRGEGPRLTPGPSQNRRLWLLLGVSRLALIDALVGYNFDVLALIYGFTTRAAVKYGVPAGTAIHYVRRATQREVDHVIAIATGDDFLSLSGRHGREIVVSAFP